VIVKTEAIILKTLKYGESSKILTLYTKEFGKISAIAKGARGMKSKFGNTLETLSLVSLVLYKKDSREIQLIAESISLHRFATIRENLDALSAAMATIELIYRTTHEEKNEPLFSLLVETLSAINNAHTNFAQLYCWFELRIAELFGFRFQLEHCPACNDILETSLAQKEFFIVTLSFGGMLCDRCATKTQRTMKISPETFSALLSLLRRSIAEVSMIEYPQNIVPETEQLLRNYLQLHIEGLKPLHSEKVFRAMTF
jgi:DNA repair protein RecO (recombination protein O)